ncbi:MAG: hypothetical protein B7Z08_09210 [Sphingomonadales bacterium 32-68-7]|nr:MAG: hypothetical protein B7Z33_11850 [Sphingomonadales bacterium 12-68-11]OYX08475.1 MAG: hypothetical protein B7Z08_09210 [Sphingomonadales bacterium 32-68-7]
MIGAGEGGNIMLKEQIPYQIRAQILRSEPYRAPLGSLLGGAPMLDDAVTPSRQDSRKGGWRQSDVRRAIAAAEQAGLALYRVEIAPDGTISIVVGAGPGTAPDSA